MFQEIAPSVFHNEYRHCLPTADSRVLAVWDGRILLHSETYEMPSAREIDRPGSLTYLFAIDEETFFLSDNAGSSQALSSPVGYRWFTLREIRAGAPRRALFAAYTGHHLALWYQSHRLCGRCGERLEHDAALRMLRCPACGLQIFPTISPAVIIAVRNGEKLLLSKYAHREYTQYALLAGFTEIGETVEETVAREVREETGLEVENLTYWGSQPWGYDGALLMGFFCDVKGDDTITVDRSELALAEWKHWRDVPDGIDDVSLTSAMMQAFRSSFAMKAQSEHS